MSRAGWTPRGAHNRIEEPTMAKVRSWVGLDVHARSVLAVTIDGESGELSSRRLSGVTADVVEFCFSLPGPTRAAYEAGPTGYGLSRALTTAGMGCVVAAPGKIERPSGDKVKTDQRDAERVLRLLMIDGLHAVRVPTGEEEALRDVVRAREAIRGDLMRARQRLSKLLLRHDVRYEDTASAWTVAHRGWLTSLDLGERGAQFTLLEYLGAIDAIVIRRDALEKTIADLIPGSPWEQTVARLRCLRGIDTLTAVGLCAEVGEFTRFEKAGQLMSYLGLTPSEDTSGEKRRQGAITKTGSRHARRLLVEAAWHYRRAPAKGQALKRRQEGQPAHIVEIAWQAQRRLHRVWQRLDTQRGKRRTIVAVAVARELSGFCWALANAD
jgi:transposase